MLPFLAALGTMAAKIGPAAAKAGAMAAKGAKAVGSGMKAATPFMEALGGLTGGGGGGAQAAQSMPMMGASAPMGVAGLNSAGPGGMPQFQQQLDPMMLEMIRRQRGMM